MFKFCYRWEYRNGTVAGRRSGVDRFCFVLRWEEKMFYYYFFENNVLKVCFFADENDPSES